MGGTLLSLQEGSAGAGGLMVGGSWTGADAKGRAWLEIGGHMSWATVGGQGLMQMILFARFYAHDLGRKP